jgi:hypothetical protein
MDPSNPTKYPCCRENEKMQQFVERMKEFECNHVVAKNDRT